jgi:type IV secretion system protein VirD4
VDNDPAKTGKSSNQAQTGQTPNQPHTGQPATKAQTDKPLGPLSPACVRALNSYISISSENTRAGVITSFRSRLELWMNPLVDAATSANDFDLRDIRKKRMSIYLGVTPDNLERLAPLMNLLFQQLIDLNTRELPNQNKALKYPCLLLMDEFTAIGKIGILSKGISYIAAYGLRMMPIIQSPSQLFDVYGKEAAQTFTTNHALQIVFPPKASETHTAKDISEWLGYRTVKGVSESRAKAFFSKRQNSESISDQRRALLLPQEITGLGQDRELVILENMPPILAHKIAYYKSHDFMDRLKEVSRSLDRLGRKLPTQKQLDEAIFKGELASSVPMINLKEHHQRMEGQDRAITVAAPQQTMTEVVTVEREATANDIPKLQTLPLNNYAVELTGIPVPKKGDLDETGMDAYARNSVAQLGADIGGYKCTEK